jgi:hypothetical protein
VLFLCNLHGPVDFAPKKEELAELLAGRETQSAAGLVIGKPYGIATRNGKLFVADTMRLNITMLDVPGLRGGTFGREGPGELKKPINCRFGTDGRLYVTDSVRNVVVVFDATGKYLTVYKGEGNFRPTWRCSRTSCTSWTSARMTSGCWTCRAAGRSG